MFMQLKFPKHSQLTSRILHMLKSFLENSWIFLEFPRGFIKSYVISCEFYWAIGMIHIFILDFLEISWNILVFLEVFLDIPGILIELPRISWDFLESVTKVSWSFPVCLDFPWVVPSLRIRNIDPMFEAGYAFKFSSIFSGIKKLKILIHENRNPMLPCQNCILSWSRWRWLKVFELPGEILGYQGCLAAKNLHLPSSQPIYTYCGLWTAEYSHS